MAYLFDVIATLDKQIEQCYRQNALCQRIGTHNLFIACPVDRLRRMPALAAT
jgi:hypothetical protein